MEPEVLLTQSTIPTFLISQKWMAHCDVNSYWFPVVFIRSALREAKAQFNLCLHWFHGVTSSLRFCLSAHSPETAVKQPFTLKQSRTQSGSNTAEVRAGTLFICCNPVQWQHERCQQTFQQWRENRTQWLISGQNHGHKEDLLQRLLL